MTDRDVAIARRVAEAAERLEVREAGFHAIGAPSFGSFDSSLHPRNRGKFAHSYAADAKKAEAKAQSEEHKAAPKTAEEHIARVTETRKALHAGYTIQDRMSKKPPTAEHARLTQEHDHAMTAAGHHLEKEGVKPAPKMTEDAMMKYVAGAKMTPDEHTNLSIADAREKVAREAGKRTSLSDTYDRIEKSHFPMEHHMEARGVVPVGSSPSRSEIKGTPPASMAQRRMDATAAGKDRDQAASMKPHAGNIADAQAAGTFLKHGRGPAGTVGFHNSTHSVEEHGGRAQVYEHTGSNSDKHIGDVPHAPASMSNDQKAGWYQAHVNALKKKNVREAVQRDAASARVELREARQSR